MSGLLAVQGQRGFHLALLGLLLSFWLAWELRDATPFTVVAPVAVGGKWLENIQERRTKDAETLDTSEEWEGRAG